MNSHNTRNMARTKPMFTLRTKLIAGAVALACAVGAPAQAAVSDDVVKIGVLTDMSGTYSDFTGQGAVIAAEMAIKDFAKDGTVLGKKIELVSADHQNKADIGSELARSWIDRDKVDVITELVTTSVALAVMDVVATASSPTTCSCSRSRSRANPPSRGTTTMSVQ